MTKPPHKLSIDKIYNSLSDSIRQGRELFCFRNGIGTAVDVGRFCIQDCDMIAMPYLLEDFRIGMVTKGSIRGVINLKEYTMSEGYIAFITPGTIVEPVEISDDFLIEGIAVPADKFLLAHGGKLPELFNGHVSDGRKATSHDASRVIDKMFRLIHDLMRLDNTSEDVILSMVTTITNYYDQLFHDPSSKAVHSNATEIFNRFLRLVNLYGRQEHQLGFYAEKLCITSRYLGSVVQATSGVTAKEWIDRAIISAAKVLLRHSDKQTSQISDELNFQTPSFFCKYFKRLTGLSPQQYRKKVI